MLLLPCLLGVLAMFFNHSITIVIFASLAALTSMASISFLPATLSLRGGDGKGMGSALAISPSGKTVAAYYSGRGAYVWVPSDEKNIINDGEQAESKFSRRFLAPAIGSVRAIDVDDAQRVLVGTDAYVAMWSIVDGKEVREEVAQISHASLLDVKFGPADDEMLVVYSVNPYNNEVVIERWNIKEKRRLKSVSTFGKIRSISFNADKSHFIISNYDTNSHRVMNNIRVYNSTNLEVLNGITMSHSGIESVYNPAGDKIALIESQKLTICDAMLNPLQALTMRNWHTALAFRGSSFWLLSFSLDKLSLVHPDRPEESQEWALPVSNRGFGQKLFSADGKNLLIWDQDAGLQWWVLPAQE